MKDNERRRLLDEAQHSRTLTEPQKRALGARLIYDSMRRHTLDRKAIAITCIRLQTYYGDVPTTPARSDLWAPIPGPACDLQAFYDSALSLMPFTVINSIVAHARRKKAA